MVKLRPGYAYDSKGRPYKVDKQAPKPQPAPRPWHEHSKEEQATIRAAYHARGKATPKHPFVLEGAVKMTPRRYELLSVVLAEGLLWVRAPDFRGGGYPREWRWSPRWGDKQVEGTLTTLRRLRLIRWREPTYDGIPEVTLTARGLAAIEEYEGRAPNANS